MEKRILAIFLALGVLLIPLFSGCLEQVTHPNHKPVVRITFPSDGAEVSQLVMISGTASDPDGDDQVTTVEVQIENTGWVQADGTTLWGYEWSTYDVSDGDYTVYARAFDSKEYSDVESIAVQVKNPKTIESEAHKWAVFVAAANFPEENESKLGNGGLYLAEEMTAYLIESCSYSTENVVILFDDGWIRDENGYGKRVETLQERTHQYTIVYGAAMKQTVVDVLEQVITESNQYGDSEVFLWVFNHGYGDQNRTVFGGKLFRQSEIFLWDDVMSDRELGDVLKPLKAKKVCVIVDACYSGGFADKTLFNLPTSLLLRSGIPQNGRIVISATSKFRKGFASTTEGPLFTNLWFEGLKTGDADGFKPGFLHRGKPMLLRFFKNGEVSVKEAFYYAKYVLRTDKSLSEYKWMEPQMNDRYPHRGLFFSRGEMVLGYTGKR